MHPLKNLKPTNVGHQRIGIPILGGERGGDLTYRRKLIGCPIFEKMGVATLYMIFFGHQF